MQSSKLPNEFAPREFDWTQFCWGRTKDLCLFRYPIGFSLSVINKDLLLVVDNQRQNRGEGHSHSRKDMIGIVWTRPLMQDESLIFLDHFLSRDCNF